MKKKATTTSESAERLIMCPNCKVSGVDTVMFVGGACPRVACDHEDGAHCECDYCTFSSAPPEGRS